MKAKIGYLILALVMVLAMVVVAVPVASAAPCINGNIQYFPCSLNFAATTQGCPGPSANLEIWGATLPALDWRVGTGTSWLSLSPAAGSWYQGEVSDKVLVTVNNTSMAPGTYSGIVTIYDWPVLLPAPINWVDVPVTLTIKDRPGLCVGDPSSLSFTADYGSNPPDQSFKVWNCCCPNQGPLYWSASVSYQQGSGWLSVSPASGTCGPDMSPTVKVTSSSMAPGTYNAQITVTGYACAMGSSPVGSSTVDVALTIEPPPPPEPLICLDRSVLSFFRDYGGSDPPTQTFKVRNCGDSGTSLSWSVQPSAGWINFVPPYPSNPLPSGTSTGEWDSVIVQLDTYGMGPSTRTGYIYVYGTGADNSPQDIQVNLTITQSFYLSTSVSPSEGGSVSPSSGTYDWSGGSYPQATLTATPDAGYTFSQWGGDASGTQNPITVTMDSNKHVTAYFIEPAPEISYSPSSFYFETVSDANPPDQTLSIWNSGGGNPGLVCD